MLANLTTAKGKDELNCNEVKQLFLADFAKTCNVYRSCKNLGLQRITIYKEWLQIDDEFARQFAAIREGHIEGIEGNLLSQALHNEKAITAQIFSLKAWKPEKYGERFEMQVSHEFSLTESTERVIERARKLLDAREVIEITTEKK